MKEMKERKRERKGRLEEIMNEWKKRMSEKRA